MVLAVFPAQPPIGFWGESDIWGESSPQTHDDAKEIARLEASPLQS